ncbi:Tudor domain-containing protein 5-like protein, partial [Leptotrombidium deliense]
MNEGIAIADFPSVYQINFREEIYLRRWKYDSFFDFFCALSFELPLSVRGGSEPKVFLESQLFADWFKSCIIEQRHSALKMFVDYPSDAVLPGETLDALEIPSDLIMTENKGNDQLSWVPTLITSAINPHSFWVHIQGKEYSDAVVALMAELEFYNEPESEAYRVPNEFIMKGLFCATKFPGDNQWHRVKIARLQASDRVTVYFIDYGGLNIVHRQDLRLLKRQFFNLKQQAIHVSLKGIKPASDGNFNKWSVQARQKVLEFSDKNYWLATLFYPKITATKYEVCICDTNGDEDVYINEVLLEEKVAVKCNAESVTEREDDSLTATNTTISNISLSQKIRLLASKSKGKHLDSIKKRLKNVKPGISSEPLLRDILQ